MAGVFNEVTIDWKGKQFVFTPSNRLLRRIEGELSPSSLTDVINRMGQGKPPISETSFIIGKFLEAAGASPEEADEDEVYKEIMNDFADPNSEGRGFLALCGMIIQVISPAEDTAKKSTPVSGGGTTVPANRADRRKSAAGAKGKGKGKQKNKPAPAGLG